MTDLKHRDPARQGSAHGTVETDFNRRDSRRPTDRVNNFEAGVAYMEFTEAVARSADTGEEIELPLHEFVVPR